MCRARRVDVSRSGKSHPALHLYGSIEKNVYCETKFAKTILIRNKPVFRINIKEKKFKCIQISPAGIENNENAKRRVRVLKLNLEFYVYD